MSMWLEKPRRSLASRGRVLNQRRATRFGRLLPILALIGGLIGVPREGRAADSPPGAQVTIAWDASTEIDVHSYRLYYGTGSRAYSDYQSTTETQTTIVGLTPGTRYFFAVTAVNDLGLESDYSTEISHVAGTPAGPRLEVTVNSNKQAVVRGVATAGKTYDVLVTHQIGGLWAILGSVRADTNGAFAFVDPVKATAASRFYRMQPAGMAAGSANIGPRLSLKVAGGKATLTGLVAPGVSYDVQMSTNPRGSWTTLGSVTAAGNGSLQFADPNAGSGNRFYRLRQR